MKIFTSIGLIFLVSICLFYFVYLVFQKKISQRKLLWFFIATTAIFIGYLFVPFERIMLTYILLILFSLSFGSFVGAGFKTSLPIIIFILIAGIVDYFSYSNGLTNMIINAYQEEKNDLLLKLTLRVYRENEMLFIMGVGDLIILTTLFKSFLNVTHKVLISFFIPLSGIILAIIVGSFVGGIYAIPFVSLFTVLYLMIFEK